MQWRVYMYHTWDKSEDVQAVIKVCLFEFSRKKKRRSSKHVTNCWILECKFYRYPYLPVAFITFSLAATWSLISWKQHTCLTAQRLTCCHILSSHCAAVVHVAQWRAGHDGGNFGAHSEQGRAGLSPEGSQGQLLWPAAGGCPFYTADTHYIRPDLTTHHTRTHEHTHICTHTHTYAHTHTHHQTTLHHTAHPHSTTTTTPHTHIYMHMLAQQIKLHNTTCTHTTTTTPPTPPPTHTHTHTHVHRIILLTHILPHTAPLPAPTQTLMYKHIH